MVLQPVEQLCLPVLAAILNTLVPSTQQLLPALYHGNLYKAMVMTAIKLVACLCQLVSHHKAWGRLLLTEIICAKRRTAVHSAYRPVCNDT